MRIVVVAVGRVKDRALSGGVDDSRGRVRRYVPCDEIELADAPAAKLEPAFLKATAEATCIALEVGGRARGREVSSRDRGRASARHRGIGPSLTGGADGLPPRVSQAAHD